ncbi:hypothetical protein [Pedobacter sp. ASV12]|uniref:hypothetical protein n=1 Tax=Pedobacter sp. ASV12 TaxID=2795120 RepID=UPI0018EDBCE3|nr:hypothetical protein [Pedobacter sp. ASV12]
MLDFYKDFFRKFYKVTGGFIPVRPLEESIYPGDFFQIVNGEMVLLGNIFRNRLIHEDDVEFSIGAKLSPVAWNFSDGVSKPYAARSKGNAALDGEFEYSRQILTFDGQGSYIFKCIAPESVRIANWTQLEKQLIIKLTHTYYSFREVYVVTESASASSWSLAISDAEKGELEIATSKENENLVDLFGDPSSKTILARDIACNHHDQSGSPCFFKAKKLVVRDSVQEVFICDLIREKSHKQQWALQFYNYERYAQAASTRVHVPAHAHASLLDMMPQNQLNANNALDYFAWADANTDDIERLFVNYGTS